MVVVTFVVLILHCVFSNCYQAQIKLGQSIYHTLNRASDPCRPGSVTHCKEKCRCFQLLKRNPIWQVLKRNPFLKEKSTFDNKSKWSPLWWRSGHLIQVENDHGERQHHLQVALCMWVHIVKSSSPSSASSSIHIMIMKLSPKIPTKTEWYINLWEKNNIFERQN